jgi:transposase-like protein
MPQRHRAAYPAEFRKQIVDLAKAGRSPDDIAKDFEPSARPFGIGSRRRSATTVLATTV